MRNHGETFYYVWVVYRVEKSDETRHYWNMSGKQLCQCLCRVVAQNPVWRSKCPRNDNCCEFDRFFWAALALVTGGPPDESDLALRLRLKRSK